MALQACRCAGASALERRRSEASFTADEARVVRQGDDVVLSLLGIKFPSGRSTIDASSAALMKKVQQGLALFPGASISVEGHTDANGSDSQNLILSQDRADAVRQYLVSNFGLNAEKVSSVGYGEARPVATNETAAGRARTRVTRIFRRMSLSDPRYKRLRLSNGNPPRVVLASLRFTTA